MDASDARYDREEGGMSVHQIADPGSPHTGTTGTSVPRILEEVSDDVNVVISGGSKDFKNQLKELGAKWAPKMRGWVLPAAKKDFLINLIKETPIDEPEGESAPEAGSSSYDAAMGVPGEAAGGSTAAPPVVGTVAQASSANELEDVLIDIAGGEPVIGNVSVETVVVETVTVEPVIEPPVIIVVDVPQVMENPEGVAPVVNGDGDGGMAVDDAPAAPGTSPADSPGKIQLVQLNSRSLALLSDSKLDPGVEGEMNKLGKWNKALKVGDQKHEGWSFTKAALGAVQALFPSLGAIQSPTASKTSRVTSPSPRKARTKSSSPHETATPAAATSPSSRKIAAQSGSSSRSSSRTETPNPSSPDKRKRQRTQRAEESIEQAQAHHAHAHTHAKEKDKEPSPA